MGSSKGSTGSNPYESSNASMGYSMFTPGGTPGWDPNHPEAYAAQAGWDAAAKSYQEEQDMMMMFEGMAAGNEAAAQAARDAKTQAEADAAERARMDTIGQRDSMIEGYFSAANSATEYVNSKIKAEKQNAALMGVDYALTDEMKSNRVADYFSTVWSEGDQQGLEKSFDGVGMGGFEQTLFRGPGTSSVAATGTLGNEKTGSGIKPKLKPGQTEDDAAALGTSTSILGA